MEGLNTLHQSLARRNKNRLINGKWIAEIELVKITGICNIDLLIAKRICADIPIWLENHDFYIQSYFNKIKLFHFPELCKSFKQIINSDLQEALFRLVLLSRDIQGIEMASSNAISLLNSSGFQFLNRDMHGIKVPYADLSCSYFHNTNLEGSDLSYTNFAFSNLEFSSFKGCNMKNCSHGWSPLIELKKCNEAWISPLKKYLVLYLGSYYEIYKLDENGIDISQSPQFIKSKFIKFSPKENYIIGEISEKGYYYIYSILNNELINDILFESLTNFAFSPSEKYFAYYSSSSLCIKEFQTNLICYQTSFDNNLSCINWSPKENFLLIQCAYEWILWDIKSSTKIQQFDFIINYKEYGKNFAFSCRENFFVIFESHMKHDEFFIWNNQTNSVKMIKIKEEVIKIKFSPIYEKIFVKSGKHLSIWNAETSEELARLKGYYSNLSADFLAPSRDQMLIIDQYVLGIYNFHKALKSRSINYHSFKSIKSPDLVIGQLLLQIDYKFSNNFYNFLNKSIKESISGCFSYNDKYFATCKNKKIFIWDMKTKEIISVLKTDNPPSSIVFSPSSKLLVVISSISDPLEAAIWNWKKKEIIWKHSFITMVRVITFSASEKFWAIGSGSLIYIWKDNSIMHYIYDDMQITLTAILCGAFTYCENYFIYGNDKGGIMYFSLSSKKIEKKIVLEFARIMVFSNSAQYIATSGRNNDIKVWNIMNEPFIIYEANEVKKPQSILWSPDNNYIIIQRRGDQSFEILDVMKRCAIFKSKSFICQIDWISWSPSGNFIIAGSLGFIGIWSFKILMELMEDREEFTDNKGSEIDCLEWASSSFVLNIQKCDFSYTNASDKNEVLYKTINN